MNGAYLGWSHTHDKSLDAHPITIEKPPFPLTLARIDGAAPSLHGMKIEESNLDAAELHPSDNSDGSAWGSHYFVWIERPPGSTASITKATIEWVHIRLSKPTFDSRSIFKDATVRGGGDVSYESYTLTLDKVPQKRGRYVFSGLTDGSKLQVDFEPKDRKGFQKIATMDDSYQGDALLVGHHSYLWLRVGVELDDGTKIDPFDFTTRGLVYYGGGLVDD
jgi:hypothetical protein